MYFIENEIESHTLYKIHLNQDKHFSLKVCCNKSDLYLIFNNKSFKKTQNKTISESKILILYQIWCGIELS